MTLKATGIVRRIDDLGRICLPKELRRTLRIEEGDPLEVFIHGDRIILRKYEPGCRFCDSADDLISVDGVRICRSCIEKLTKNYLEA